MITPNGHPAALWRAVVDERPGLLTYPHLLAELAEVLERPEFRRYVSIEEAGAFVDEVARFRSRLPDNKKGHRRGQRSRRSSRVLCRAVAPLVLSPDDVAAIAGVLHLSNRPMVWLGAVLGLRWGGRRVHRRVALRPPRHAGLTVLRGDACVVAQELGKELPIGSARRGRCRLFNAPILDRAEARPLARVIGHDLTAQKRDEQTDITA